MVHCPEWMKYFLAAGLSMLADASTEYVPKCKLLIHILLDHLTLAWGYEERKNVISRTTGLEIGGNLVVSRLSQSPSCMELSTLDCKTRGLDKVILGTGTQ